MANLLAFCRTQAGPTIKRIQISQPLQDKLGGLFQQQAIQFMEGIDEEIEFGSDWKPDTNEIVVMDVPAEAELLQTALGGNLLALPTVNADKFLNEGIKGLFVQMERRILVQSFTAQQVLSRRFSLLLEGDTFRELTEPSFTMDSQLVAVIENSKLKFKSFHKVKRIFELTQIYQEATDQQIDSFCAHASLAVEDVGEFKNVADQGIRKLVHAVAATNVLDQHTVEDIEAKAAALGIEVTVTNGLLLMPADRKGAKALLKFLDDAIYEAPLSAKRYMTNSKRPY